MERKVGTVSRGIRCPIIRQGDDLAQIVIDSIRQAMEVDGLAPRDRDVVAMTDHLSIGPVPEYGQPTPDSAKTKRGSKAAKAVEVAKLEKEKAVIEVERQKEVAKVEAEKLLVVAEVQKKTEAENLEAVKLKAEQKVAEAKAKKEAIALAGEITEAEKLKLEIEKETKIGVAEQLSKTYAHWNPQVIQVSGGANGGSVNSTTTALDNFLNMNAAKAAIDMTSKVNAPQTTIVK